MKWVIFSCLWAGVLAEFKTVDVGPILDLDLTLYKLTYDKDKGQTLSDFSSENGFIANNVEIRGIESTERVGQAYIAVDGPIYSMAYTLQVPGLNFLFGKLDIPGMGSFTNARVTSTENQMDRFLEYTPLKNSRCLVSDGVAWSDIGNALLHVGEQPPKDVTQFFNSTFKAALNSRLGYANIEQDSYKCKEFTTPFTTITI